MNKNATLFCYSLVEFFFFLTIMTPATEPPITTSAAITMIHQEKPEDGSAPEGCFSPDASLSPVEIVLPLFSVGSVSSAGSLTISPALITYVSVALHTVQVKILSPSEVSDGSFVTLPSSH